VSQVSVEQKLPTGGTLTANIVNNLMRDLGRHITSGESGQVMIAANIPLLRGAGRAAYETRYQAERNLIYAAREFEAFRRSFLVDIATDFFRLLSLRSQVESAIASQEAFAVDVERVRALAKAERAISVDVDRAEVQYLEAQNRVVNTQEQFSNALDAFKIRIGMPTETPLEIGDEEIELHDPRVPEDPAIETALVYRLDLLNVLDSVDDARRGVAVAQNHLLPDFNFSGNVSVPTDPALKNSVHYNYDRAVWRGMLDLEVPLDRKAERNMYRSSLITQRRAERMLDQTREQVRLDVRRALRRLEQARFSMEIQRRNIEINEFRRRVARAQFDIGRLTSNRDVIEAENDLRLAKDSFAEALSNYRQVILEFLRDTGTLRVDDDGHWVRQSDLKVSGAPGGTAQEGPLIPDGARDAPQ
jgi:outer membrane protein TolC